MRVIQAFLAGVVGGATMSLITALARTMGMPVNWELILGTFFGAPPSRTAWLTGLILFLVLSGLIALLYAIGFEHVTRRAGWSVGLVFSFVHTLVAGTLVGLVPALHPLVPESLPAPGAFMANLGTLGIGIFVLSHLIYGAIVGTLYAPLHYESARMREPTHVPVENPRVGRIAATPEWDVESSEAADARTERTGAADTRHPRHGQ